MKKRLFASLLVISVLSCKENKHHTEPIVENAVDQSESSVSSSFKRAPSESMVNRTYYELIKNDKALKALDEKIEKVYKETRNTLAVYEEILSVSETFYYDAHNQAKTITDSLLKQQIEKEIKINSDAYDVKTKHIRDIITRINTNKEAIDNLYTAFKIRKTLPEIEKYQKGHPLKADSLNAVINKQNKLLEEIKNLK